MEPNSSSHATSRDDAQLLAEMGWLRKLAARLVQDPSLADDLAQQAWLAASREQRTWSSRGDLRSWLAKVVQNLARRTASSERRRKEIESLAHDEPRHAPAADELVVRAQLQAELAQAVLELDEPHKSAILLRFLDELDHKTMGERLGISADAARKRVERALQELRARLDARHRHERGQWLAALTAFVDGPPPQAAPLAPLAHAWLAAAGVIAVLVGAAALLPWADAPTTPPVTAGGAGAAAELQPLGVPATQGGSGGSKLAATAAASFQLREEAGGPAVGYCVQPHDGVRLLAPLVSDAEGRVSWPADAPPHALLVWRHDYVLSRVDLPPPGGEQVATLPEGSHLAGTVHGRLPGRPCHVRLTHERPDPRLLQLGASGTLNPSTGSLETAPPSARGQMLALAADGGFLLRGLPQGWSGVLELRMPYIWNGTASPGTYGSDAALTAFGGPNELRLPGATTQLQARVASLPCVRGRLVEGAEQRPLSRGTLGVAWSCESGTGTFPVPLGADGGFWLPLTAAMGRCGNSGVRLQLSGRSWTRELAAAELVDGGDLGVLEVPATDTWHLVVLDHEGRPLPEARIAVQQPAGDVLVWHETDHAGAAEFLAEPGSERLVRVTRAGHKPCYLRTGPGAPSAAPEVVQLARAADLLVRAVDASGLGLPGAVRVSAPQASEPSRGWRDLGGLEGEALAAELRWLDIQGGPLGVAAHLEPGRSARIENVVRGTPLLLEWLDQTATVQASASITLPLDAWTGAVDIVWSGNGFRVRGSVRDETGAAVAGAQVELGRNRDEFNVATLTGEDGSYEFAALRTPLQDMSLFASKLGRAPVKTPTRDFGPQDETVDLVLPPSRPLLLRVVDAQGRPVQGGEVRARFPAPHGELPLVKEPQGGIHRTSDAPFVAGIAEVTIAGSTSSFALPAQDDPAPLVLAGLGALQLSLGPATSGAAREVEVCAQGATSAAVLKAERGVGADGTLAPFLLHLPPGTWTLTVRTRAAASSTWTVQGAPRTATVASGVDTPLDYP